MKIIHKGRNHTPLSRESMFYSCENLVPGNCLPWDSVLFVWKNLEQWFSDFSVHQHPFGGKGMLKYRTGFWFSRAGRGPSICISNKFPGDAAAVVWAHTLRTTGPGSEVLSGRNRKYHMIYFHSLNIATNSPFLTSLILLFIFQLLILCSH